MSSNLTDVVFGPEGPDYGSRGSVLQLIGVMAEWLRRQTRNLVGSALVGSNPADVGGNFCHFADAADRLRPTRIRFASLCHASIVQG